MMGLREREMGRWVFLYDKSKCFEILAKSQLKKRDTRQLKT